MPLITLVITLVVVGVVMYLINNYAPMDPRYKTFVNYAVVIVVAIWLLQVLGVWSYLQLITVPSLGRR